MSARSPSPNRTLVGPLLVLLPILVFIALVILNPQVPLHDRWSILLEDRDFEEFPCLERESMFDCVTRRWDAYGPGLRRYASDGPYPEVARTLCELGACAPDNLERGPWLWACDRIGYTPIFDEIVDICSCPRGDLLLNFARKSRRDPDSLEPGWKAFAYQEAMKSTLHDYEILCGDPASDPPAPQGDESRSAASSSVISPARTARSISPTSGRR